MWKGSSRLSAPSSPQRRGPAARPKTSRRLCRSRELRAESRELRPKGGRDMPEFTLPPLPYDYAALEPYIDEQTMRIHHDKHHQAYVDKANAALEGTGEENASVDHILTILDELPEDKRMVVRNNAGGHANHSLFWQIMSPDGGGEPEGAL